MGSAFYFFNRDQNFEKCLIKKQCADFYGNDELELEEKP